MTISSHAQQAESNTSKGVMANPVLENLKRECQELVNVVISHLKLPLASPILQALSLCQIPRQHVWVHDFDRFLGDDEILLYSQPYLLMDWQMVFYTINFVQNRPVLFVYGRIRECFLWGESVLTSVSGIRNSERLSDQLKRSFNSYHATPCHSHYFILAKNELFSFLFSIQRPIYAEKKLEEMAGEVFVRERDQYIVYSIQFVVADAANEFLSNPSVAPPTIVVVVGKRHVFGIEYFFRGGL